MEQNLFRYIWNHTKPDQLRILFIVLISMPTYFLFFDLPKQIVNGPIQGRGFETADTTVRFLELSFSVPEWISSGGRLDLFSGFELDRLGYLTALSMVFLLLVCINGLFKFYINTFKGRLGERTLRRLRYELIDRVLRYRPAVVRKMKASEVATMVKDEVEPLGVFIGEAFVDPVFLSGQALVAMLFIMVQSVWLGSIALAIVLLQAVIIPRMRRRLLELGKRRQLEARALAGRVGEIIDGVTEIHVNDTSNFERADISSRLGSIFFLRFDFYKRKFFIKFLNNFLSQITPFLFYFIGGYFAITGQMDLGQLVAVIAAYKDLPNPIRDLINWDQTRLDVQIKYTQVVAQFASEDILPPEEQKPVKENVGQLSGDIIASNIGATDETGATLLEAASFKLKLNEHTAIIGEVNSGAEAAGDLMVKLLPLSTGSIQIGGKDLSDLPETVTGRRISYIGPDTYLRQTSIRDNLLYGLKHYPLREPGENSDQEKIRKLRDKEAVLTGNPTLDLTADWIDYNAAGISDPSQMDDQILKILKLTDLADDMFNLGLRGLIDPATNPQLAQQMVQARMVLHKKLASPRLAKLVEPFDPDKYNNQATVAENILFGTGLSDGFKEADHIGNEYLLDVLAQTGIDETLFRMGRSITKTILELFANLPPDHPFFQQQNFISPDEVSVYEDLLKRDTGQSFAQAAPEDRMLLLKMSYAYVEPKHRLSLLDDALRDKLLKTRKAFRNGLPEELSSAIELYDPGRYNAMSSLEDNILFGRITDDVADATKLVHEEVGLVLEELDLAPAVFNVGLNFNVGIGGKLLSAVQRQKLSLARALLRRPDYLVINKGFAILDGAQQGKFVQLVLSHCKENGIGVFWVLMNPGLAEKFDHALVFKDGGLAEQGTPDTLQAKGGVYTQLAS